MLREEQIDLRRRRAAEGQFRIQNLGRNRVFSDYQITNPKTGGQYRVSIRGFDVGDNTCECPDFRTNTLGTCKHIEAVLASLREETPPQLRRRKAAVTHPEIYLHYGEQLRIGLHLPPRHSDPLRALAEAFFDPRGLWKGGDAYQKLIELVESVPEQVSIFSDAMEFMEREIERHEMAQRERDLLAQLEAGEMPEELRDLLRVPLYPYQMRGALFLACRGRAILGDDMGLGKTVQTLAAVELLVRQPTFYRLINYEIAVRDLDELNAWQPDLIVLDEAQRIKNWVAKTTRAVKRLRSRYAFVLTGTPLENKLEELYSIVQFVDDRRLGPAFQFLHDHRLLDEDGKLLGYRNLDKIREKLAPILLRRTREEVLSQLPARTDTTVYVEMADAQRGPYAEHSHTLARLLQKKYLTEIDRRRILASITNLRMLCDSTFLLDQQTKVSPKLDELEELLRELLFSGPHKIVIFSQWETMLRLAAEVVENLGAGFAVLHGGIPGKERRGLLERFRDDGDCRVFLSTDAGGTGLNLQAADTVINLEVPWNPAVLEQRIARVHRMGQHRPVQVFNLVTRHTIEERVLRTLDRKRELFAGVFTGESDEVVFAHLGHSAFLQTVRELVGEAKPTEVPTSEPAVGETATDPRQAVVQASVQFLEALAALLGERGCVSAPSAGSSPEQANGNGASPLASFLATDAQGRPVLQVPAPSPEMLERGAAAIRAIVQKFNSA